MDNTRLFRDLYGEDPTLDATNSGLDRARNLTEQDPLELQLEIMNSEYSPYRSGFSSMDQGIPFNYDSPYGVVYRQDGHFEESRVEASKGLKRSIMHPLSRLSVGVLGTLLEAGGFMLGGAYGLVSNIGQDNYWNKVMDTAVDNGLVNFFEDTREGINENLIPIYSTSKFDRQTTLQKIKSLDASFWGTDVMDTLAFTLSSFVPGAILSKAGTGIKVLQGVAKAKKSQQLSRLLKLAKTPKGAQHVARIAPRIKNIADKIDYGTTLVTSSFIEAMFEGKDMRESILTNPELRERYSQAELEEYAADAAQNVFLMNMATLMFTNFVEVGTLFNKNVLRNVRPSRKRSGNIFDSSIIRNKETNALEFKKSKGLKAALANPWTKLLATGGANVIAEGGIEENMQYVIQASNAIPLLDDNPSMGGAWGELWNQMKESFSWDAYRGDEERQGSMALGAAIGVGSTAVSNSPLRKILPTPLQGETVFEKHRNLKESKRKFVEQINNFTGSTNNIDIWDRGPDQDVVLTTREGEFYAAINGKEDIVSEKRYNELKEMANIEGEGGKGTIPGEINMKNGQPVVNSEKLNKYMTGMKRHLIIDEMLNALSEDSERNAVAIKFLKNEKLAALAKSYFEAGVGDLLIEQLEAAKNAPEDQINHLGFTKEGVSPEEMQDRIDYVKELEGIYNDSLESVATSSRRLEPIAEQRKAYLYDKAQRLASIDHVSKEMMLDTAAFVFDELYSLYQENGPLSGQEGADELAGTVRSIVKMIDDYTKLRPSGDKALRHKYAQQIDKAITDFLGTTGNEALKSNPEFARTWALAAKKLMGVKFLMEERSNIYKDWTKVADFVSGEQFFLDNKARLTRPERVLNTLIHLTDTTSPNEYLVFEDDMFYRKRIQEEFNLAEARHFAIAWREHAAQEESTPATLVEYLISNRAALTSADLAEIYEYINPFLEEWNRLHQEINPLRAQLKAAEERIHDAEDFEVDPNPADIALVEELKTQLGPLEAALEKYKEESQIDQLPVNLQEYLEENLEIKNLNLPSEEDIRRKIILEFLGGFNQLEQVFEVNEGFDDLAFAEEVVSQLTNLVRVNSKRKDSFASTQTYENTMNDIKEALAKAEKMRDTIEKRVNARLRKDKLAKQFRIKQLYYTLGFSSDRELQGELKDVLVEEFGEEQVNKILNEFATADLIEDELTEDETIESLDATYYYALIDLMSQSENPQRFIDILFQSRSVQQHVQELVNLANKRRNVTEETGLYRVLRNMESFVAGEEVSIKKLLKDYLIYMQDIAGKDPFDSRPESSIFKYLNDENIFDFVNNAQTEDRSGSSVPSEAVQAIANIYSILLHLSDVQNAILYGDSNLSAMENKKTLLTTHKERVVKGVKGLMSPTGEQNVAIDQIISAYTQIQESNSAEKFEDIMYLKGPAGSGKTNVVVRWVLAMMPHLKSKNILAAGHNQHSAKTLHDSIKPKADALNIKDLIKALQAGSVDSKVQFIVLDEIGGVSEKDLSDLADALSVYNKRRLRDNKRKASLLVMGDPNQRLSSETGTPAIERPTKGISKRKVSPLDGIHKIKAINPLTLTFRSDNPSIVMVQKVFEGSSKKVDRLNGRANFAEGELSAMTTPLQGSYIDSSNVMLMPILEKSLALSPKKEKAVIVNNSAAKKSYTDMLTKRFPEAMSSGIITVLTIEEAQGRTIPEVYVDISPASETDDKKITRMINTDLYTATSRAVDFLYVARMPNAQNNLDMGMESRVQSNQKEKIDSFDNMINELQRMIDTLKELGIKYKRKESLRDTNKDEGEEVPETKEQEQNNEKAEEIIEEEESIPEEETPEPEPKPEIGEDETITETEEEVEPTRERPTKSEKDNGGSIQVPPGRSIRTLAEPQHAIFNPIIDESNTEIYEGLEAQLEDGPIEARIVTLDNGTGATQVAILAPINSDKGIFAKVAVLTRKEIEDYGIDYDAVPKTPYSAVADPKGTVVSIPPDTDSIPVTISDTSSKFSMKYRTSPEDRRPLVSIAPIVEKVVRGMSDRQAPIDMSQAEYSIRIFSEKEVDEMQGQNFEPQEGYAYLEISNWKREGATRFAKPLYIRLINNSLAETSESEREYHTGKIRSFIELIEEMERLLAEDYSLPFRLGSREFTRFVYEIVDLHVITLGKKKRYQEFDKNFRYLLKHFGSEIEQQFQDGLHGDLIDLAIKIDEAVHGTLIREDGSVRARRNHNGAAQKQFDRLARNNLYMVGPRNQVITLRDVRRFINKKKKIDKEELVGRTLLGFKDRGWVTRAHDWVKDYFKGHLERLASKKKPTEREMTILNSFEGNEDASNLSREIYGRDGTTTLVMDTDQLRHLLEVETDHMRVPLDIHSWNNAPVENDMVIIKGEKIPLVNMFKENFEGVDNNKVKVFFPDFPSRLLKENEERPEPTTNTRSSRAGSARSRRRDMRGKGPRLSVAANDPGQPISIAEAVEMYRQYVPRTFMQVMRRWFNFATPASQEKLPFKVISAARMEKLAGEPAWGMYMDGVIYLLEASPGQVYSKALKHEVFHKMFYQHLDIMERSMMYKWAKEQNPGEANPEILEEYMALKFQEWKMGKKTFASWLSKLFDKILQALRLTRKYASTMDEMFDRISRGIYGRQLIKDGDIEISMRSAQLETLFTDVETYARSKQMLLEYTNYFYTGGNIEEEGYTPATFEEAIAYAYTDMQELKEILEKDRDGYTELQNGVEVLVPGTGLTKDEELELEVVTILTNQGKQAFSALVSTTFPDAKLSEIYTNLQEQLEEEETSVGLYEQIMEAEDKDPMKSVIKSVKQFLSLISYKSKKETKYVPFNQTYAILLKTMNSFDTTEHPSLLAEHLRAEFKDHLGTKAGKAIFNYIVELIDLVKQDLQTPQHLAFFSDNVFMYDKSKTLDLSKADPTAQDANYQIWRRREDETLAQFFDRVYRLLQAEGETLSREDLATKHRGYRAKNLWNNMVVSFRSMREKRPMLGINSYVQDNLREHRYIENRMSGTKPVFMSAIQERIKKSVEQALIQENPLESDIPEFGKETPYKVTKSHYNPKTENPTDFRRKKIREFVAMLLSPAEAKRFNKDIPKEKVRKVYSSMRTTIKIVKDYLAQPEERRMPIHEFMSDLEGFSTLLADTLHTQDIKHSSPNYIRADGKRGYAHQFSSFAMEMMKKLERGIHTALPFINDPVMSRNQFLVGKSPLKFFRYVDHDGTKYEGRDQSAKLYRKETPRTWYIRNFLDQFLGRMTMPNNQDRYVQSVFPISNKPNIVGAEVAYIHPDDYDTALQAMIDQENELKKKWENTHTKYKTFRNESALIPGKELGTVTLQELREFIDQGHTLFMKEIAKYGIHSTSNVLEFYAPSRKTGYSPDVKVANEVAQRAEEEFADDLARVNEMTEEEENQLNMRISQFQKKLLGGDENVVMTLYNDAAKAYVYNFFINSHQLNQLLVGPEQYYKDIYDITKRMSILFAPGRVGNVNEMIGMPVKSKVMVLRDWVEQARPIPGMPEHLIGKDIEATDAQGYVLPEYWSKVKRSFGSESEVDTVLKPVYAGIGEDGVPLGIKYSAIVLTDQLVEQFPELGELRNMMREAPGGPIDQATFASAVKMGMPAKENLTNISEDGVIGEFNSLGVVEIDNRNLRLQFNPAHDTISNVTNPSQLTYFPIMSESSFRDHDKLLNLNAEMINIGIDVVDRMLSLNAGNPTRSGRNNTKKAIRKLAKKAWDGLAGSENLHRLVSNPKIDLNLPIISNKVMSTIASKVQKKTVDFKLRGSKLYLVSEFGSYDRSLKKKQKRLEWRTKDGSTEVIIPQSIADYYNIKTGDQFSFADYRAIGFRLPSTGLHSALVLKVKEVIPDPPNMKNNIIILPSHVVLNHGSDYDIDSLFVLNGKKVKELTKTGNSIQLGKILGQVFENINPDLDLSAESILNYDTEGNKIYVDKNGYPASAEDGMPLQEFLSLMYMNMRQEIVLLQSMPELSEEEEHILNMLAGTVEETTDGTGDGAYTAGLERQLLVLYQTSTKNEIIQTFTDILTDQKNRKWMELPIIMERLKALNTPEGVEKSPLQILQDYGKELYPNKSLNLPTTQREIHTNTFSGASLTGAAANVVKVIAYLFKAAGGDNVRVNSDLALNMFGRKWEEFSRTERKVEDGSFVDNEVIVGYKKNGEPIKRVHSIWETLDALINAAIDNVKEQILYHLNLTDSTSNEFFTMLAYGVPVQDVTRFFQSPIINMGLEQQSLRKGELYKLRNNVANMILDKEWEALEDKESVNENEWREAKAEEILDEDNIVSISREALDKANKAYFKDEAGFAGLDVDDLKLQLAIVKEFRKLAQIGEAMFNSSLALQTLRKFDGTYAENKHTLDSIFENIGTFSGGRQEAREQIKEYIKSIKKSSAYKMLETKEAKDNYISSRLAKRFQPELKSNVFDVESYLSMKERAMLNRVRHGTFGFILNSSKWPFVNANLLTLPNFRQSIRALQRLLNVMEKTFVQHSRTMNHYASRLAKELSKKYYGADNIENTKSQIKKELMHYFMTSLDLSFSDEEGNTSNINLGNETEQGYREWVEDLRDDILHARWALDNDFITSLQLVPDKETGAYRIVFTSDKSQEDLEIQKFRVAFEELGNEKSRKKLGDKTKGPLSKLQIDLIKYLLLTSGLDFGRTSYSGVIPEFVFEELSRKFQRFAEVALPETGSQDSTVRMDNLYENFKIQYMLNNIDDVPSLNYAKILKSEEGNKGRIEFDDGDYLHYDLAYSQVKTPEYIRHRKALYKKVHDDENNSYFQRIGSGRKIKLYHVPQDVIEFGFDPEEVFSGTFILPESFVNTRKKDGVYTTSYVSLPGTKLPVNVGDNVYVHNPADLSFTKMVGREVLEVSETKSGATKIILGDPFDLVYDYEDGPVREDPLDELIDEVQEEDRDVITLMEEQSSLNATLLTEETLKYIENNGDPIQKEILKVARRIGALNDLSIRLFKATDTEETAGFIRTGHFRRSRTIFVKEDAFQDPEDFMDTVIHELIHIITVGAIDYKRAKRDFAEQADMNEEDMHRALLDAGISQSTIDAMQQYSEEMDALWQEIKDNAGLSLIEFDYEMSNSKELIAYAWTNEEFRNRLSKIQLKGKESALQKIIRLIAKLINRLGGKQLAEAIGYNPNRASALDHVIAKSFELMNFYQDNVITEFVTFDEVKDVVEDSSHILLDTFLTEKVAKQQKKKHRPVENVLNASIKQGLKVLDDDFYTDKQGNKWTRLTKFFNDQFFTKYQGKELKVHEYRARKDFDRQAIPYDGIFTDKSGGRFTLEERENHYLVEMETARQVGNYIHAHLQSIFETDPQEKYELFELKQEIARMKFNPDGTLKQNAIDTRYLEYLQDPKNLQTIFDKSGIDFKVKEGKGTDVVHPELTLHSEALGFGTTIDGLIEDKYGLLSILDWKTGSLLSDFDTAQIMRYGLDTNVKDSKLNRAKMEVVLRAFAVKEHAPDARFKRLTVNRVSKNQLVEVHDIELQDFLTIIDKYVESTNPDGYQALKDQGMFNAAKYWGAVTTNDLVPNYVQQKPIAEQREWLDRKLEEMKLRYTTPTINANKGLKEKQDAYVRARLELDKIEGLNYDASEKDIGLWSRWFTGMKGSNSKFLRTFNKIFLQHKREAEKLTNAIDDDHDNAIEAVLEEYRKRKGLNKRIGLISLPGSGFVSKRDLFSFMWRYYDKPNMKGWYMNLENTYLDNGVEVPLTQAQKNYREHIRNNMAKMHKKVMGRKVYRDDMRNNVTRAESEGKPVELYKEFLPRVPITWGEAIHNQPANEGLNVTKASWLQKLNKFLEADSGESSSKSIPLRYYADRNSDIIITESFSFDVEKAYKEYMKSLVYKEEMSSVYAFGEGLKNYLATRTDEKGEILYPRLAKFLDDAIILNVLNSTRKSKLSEKPLKFYVNSEMAEWLGVTPGQKEITFDKAMDILRNSSSFIAMAFKMVSGAFNGALVTFLTIKKALTGTLAKRFAGVKAEDIDFSLRDLTWAFAQVPKYWADWMQGGRNASKLWNVAKKLNYLSDNYDFKVGEHRLRARVNSAFRYSNFFWFHTIFENYISMMTLAAQLKHQKFTVDGQEKSLWDLYDNEGNYIGGVRGYTKDKDGTLQELTDLRSEEVSKMKRVHELVHGSYRKEEEVALAATAFGKWALQFKKYLPMIIGNLFRSERTDDSLGKFVGKKEFIPEFDENGILIQNKEMTVYEWEAAVHEGRIRTLLNFIRGGIASKTGLGAQGFDYKNYRASEILKNPRKKQDLLDLVSTGIMFVFMMALYSGFGVDDEEYNNTYWRWRWDRLIRDVTQGIDPRDILHPIARDPVVIFTMADKIVGAAMEYMWAVGENIHEPGSGRLRNGGMPGAKTLSKHIPIYNGWIQIQNIKKDLEWWEKTSLKR